MIFSQIYLRNTSKHVIFCFYNFPGLALSLSLSLFLSLSLSFYHQVASAMYKHLIIRNMKALKIRQHAATSEQIWARP